MGCASSTPMVQTAGSDMLKAATHVADDATQVAEDAVQGVKDSVGKTLETAKETITTKVEEVKHDVENTLKEQVQNLDEAKNTLMGKMHLSPPAAESTHEMGKSTVEAMKGNVTATAEKETKDITETLKQTSVTTMASSSSGSGGGAGSETDTVRLARTDTETDSLRTSTPEPEIERALANAKANSGDDENPPTPVPTYSELENLGNELLQQQHQKLVNDMDAPTTNDPLTTTADNKTSMTNANANATTTNTITDTINASTMHITPITITTATSLASAIAATTTSALQDTNVFMCLAAAAEPTMSSQANEPPPKAKTVKRDEKMAAERAKQQKQIQKLLEEKRPGTTEWEKYADMLALFRKFNPHDAFRRGGTLTKFNGHTPHFGATPIRERPGHVGRGDDDSSDTTSNWGRKSPGLRSSARAGGRMHRPNSANHRYGHSNATRRNSNAMSSGGRKFDYNPTRGRVNDRGSSSSVSSGPIFRNSPTNATANAYRLSPAVYGTQTPALAHASVKSPLEMRSQHSPLGTYTMQRQDSLWPQQSDHNNQTSKYSNNTSPPPLPQPTGGSSMPLNAIPPNIQQQLPALTRESSNTSFSSQKTSQGHIRSYKSSTDLRTSGLLMTTCHQPHHHQHYHQQPQQHLNPPVRNTSSFLATPRTSPFSLTKSYTDLYFSSSSNKENETTLPTDFSSVGQQRHNREKSPYRMRQRCEICCKKYTVTV